MQRMSTDALSKQLAHLYPFWQALPEKLRAQVLQHAQQIYIASGDAVFHEGQSCFGFPLVLSGCVRVAKSSTAGRELLLYRVQPGDSCIISCNSLFRKGAYEAHAATEGETQLLLLPPPLFNALLDNSAFRDSVLSNFSERLSDLMLLVEEIAFRRLDERLAALLLQSTDKVLNTSHQRLADELGSVRVFITRLLNEFATQGLVRLGREYIEVIDTAKLRRLANNAALT